MTKSSFGENIFVIIFLACLFVYAGLSARQTIPKIEEELNAFDYSSDDALKGAIASIDANISQEAYDRYAYIEMYGVLNKALGKKEINGFDYALDEYGGYNPINFCDEVDNIDYKLVAERVLALKTDAEEHGAIFMYLQSPDKLDDAWNTGIPGIPYEDKNEKTDRLLAWFHRYGIDCIDFRESLANSNLTYTEMFYNTDHHWTGVAAFVAFRDLVGHMNEEYGQGLDEDYYYRNIDNYTISYCEDVYLGSAGRDIGFSYGVCEDHMQLVVPKFDGNISWMGYNGNYKDTVFRYDHLVGENPYNTDTYGFYLYGVAKEDVIINKGNPDGLKILFIRDSFMSPIIIDMIPLCSEIDCYWGLYVDDKTLKDKIANGNYDYVILTYGTLNIEEDNFNFYVEETDENVVITEEL